MQSSEVAVGGQGHARLGARAIAATIGWRRDPDVRYARGRHWNRRVRPAESFEDPRPSHIAEDHSPGGRPQRRDGAMLEIGGGGSFPSAPRSWSGERKRHVRVGLRLPRIRSAIGGSVHARSAIWSDG